MRRRGLGLGKVGMEKLRFLHGGVVCEIFAQGRGGVRVSHRVLFTRALEDFGLDGDVENLWPLRVGKAGLGMKKICHGE